MPRPRLDAKDLRVPLNCTISPATKEALTGLQNDTSESQGEIIDRAVALLALGEEAPVVSRGKVNKRVLAAQEREQSDVTAQVVERDDIDYTDTDSLPHTHVVSRPIASKNTHSTMSMDRWRATRKPILKPKDRSR